MWQDNNLLTYKNKYNGEAILAAFDLDCTLVDRNKKLLHNYIPKDNEHMLIITNQSNSKSIEKTKHAIDKLFPNASVLMSTTYDCYRKPSPFGVAHFIAINKIVNPRGFFVGDAAGRTMDFAASDRQLSYNLNALNIMKCKFYTPEEFFYNHAPTSFNIGKTLYERVNHYIGRIVNEIPSGSYIMCGPPGAGKSTLCQQLVAKYGGKIYKNISSPKKGNVYVDGCHRSAASRQKILDVIPNCKVIYFPITKDAAMARNEYRERQLIMNGIYEKRIPNVAFHTHFKNFEKPKKAIKYLATLDEDQLLNTY